MNPARRVLVPGAMLALAAAVATGCGSPAKTTANSRSAGATVSSSPDYSASGPTGSSGRPTGPTGYTGPGGYTGASGYTDVSGLGGTGPHPDCYGYWTYGLCVPLSKYTGPAAYPSVRSDIGLTCRIAVSNIAPGSGGFISLPGGKFTADPRSNVSINYPSGRQPQMVQPPSFGLSYNAHAGRWYPVEREAVSPDGTRYAYSYDNTGLHVVSVADGSEVVLGKDRPWRVLLFEAAGVYVAPNDGGLGVWYLPLNKSGVFKITDSGWWTAAAGGVAYGQVAQPWTSGATNAVLRLDLNNATVQTWWSDAPGNGGVHQLTAAPDGSLLVALASGAVDGIIDIRRIAQADHWESVLVGPSGRLTGPIVVDAHGTWLTSSSSQGPLMWFVSGAGYWPFSSVAGELGSGCD